MKVWNVATGKELLNLRASKLRHKRFDGTEIDRASGYVHSVAFSPDGKRLAAGYDDTTVRIWDVAD